jgi:hypothetical protein
MGARKQRENERNYLEPALDRLQPYYAELFDMLFRGKQRNEGLMVDKDAWKERQRHLRERAGEVKDERREIERQVTREVTSDILGEEYEYTYEVKDDYGREAYEQVKEEKQSRMDERDLPEVNWTEEEKTMKEANIIRNKISSDDSSRYGEGMAIKNMSARFNDKERTRRLEAVAKLFGLMREDADATPRDAITFTESHGMFSEETHEKMNDRSREDLKFLQNEVMK